MNEVRWTCQHCGTSNHLINTKCQKCGFVPEDKLMNDLFKKKE